MPLASNLVVALSRWKQGEHEVRQLFLHLALGRCSGTSVGDVTLWAADPAAPASAATSCQALTSVGTALLPDKQAAMVLDMAVVAAAAAAPDAGLTSSSTGSSWQLLLAAGKTLGCITAWRSELLISNTATSSPAAADGKPAAAASLFSAYSRQQLSLAVSSGTSCSRRCHGAGFVTGVLWSPLDQQLASCGADGQLLTWVWGKDGLEAGRACSRFNRQWLRPSAASAMTPAARRVSPMAGLAGSGGRLVMAVARSWQVTEVSV